MEWWCVSDSDWCWFIWLEQEWRYFGMCADLFTSPSGRSNSVHQLLPVYKRWRYSSAILTTDGHAPDIDRTRQDIRGLVFAKLDLIRIHPVCRTVLKSHALCFLIEKWKSLIWLHAPCTCYLDRSFIIIALNSDATNKRSRGPLYILERLVICGIDMIYDTPQ